MNNLSQHKRVEKWQLNKLKPHPQQQEIFRSPTVEEIDRLAASMQSEPVTTLVEILPDGTIVCGHSRVQAARQLGWTELDVWVREDLAAQGHAAVIRRLINDNFVRRQLSPLDQARCLQRLVELEKQSGQRSKVSGNLRDRIAATQKMSGRNLERYLNVLKTPMEVQAAFDEKQLSLTEASRVAGMKAEDQKLVAEAIARGESPRQAVQRMLFEDKSWKQKPENGTVSYLRPLENWRQKMQGRMPEIKTVNPDDADRIRKTMAVLKELLQRSQPDADHGKRATGKVMSRRPADQADAGNANTDHTGKSTSPDGVGAKKLERKAVSGGAGTREERHR